VQIKESSGGPTKSKSQLHGYTINLDPEGCLQIYKSTDTKEPIHSFPVN